MSQPRLTVKQMVAEIQTPAVQLLRRAPPYRYNTPKITRDADQPAGIVSSRIAELQKISESNITPYQIDLPTKPTKIPMHVAGNTIAPNVLAGNTIASNVLEPVAPVIDPHVNDLAPAQPAPVQRAQPSIEQIKMILMYQYTVPVLKSTSRHHKLKPNGTTKKDYVDAIVRRFGDRALDDGIVCR